MTPALPSGAADYRDVAHQILAERRFHPPPLPRPLHGLLDSIGNALAPIGHAFERAFAWVAGIVPGGEAAVWALLGAAVVGLAALASTQVLERTVTERSAAGARIDAAADAPDARALEAAADAAERAGRLEQALRLRFQAGLLRLDELGVVAYRPSLPNAAVARRLRSPIFDALARRFEEVAYGGRTARPDDIGSAREGWRRVLAEVGRRR